MPRLVTGLLICLGIVGAIAITCTPEPGTPPNKPIGKARGHYPGRVVWVHHPPVARWDGKSKFWWNEKFTDLEATEKMLSVSLRSLTGASSDAAAWDVLFRDFNVRRSGVSRGYQKGEKIGIKINLNGFYGKYDNSNANGLSPQYLKSVLRQLVNVVGVAQSDICVVEAARWFVDAYYDAPEGCHDEFPGVHFVDNAGEKGREKVVPTATSRLFFSSKDVPVWDVTHLPTCLTDATYALLIDNFRGHDMAGITLSGKNYFGAIHRPVPGVECGMAGYWCPISVHEFANVSARAMGTYNVLVDLLGHPDLGDKVMVFLMDGLYGGYVEYPEPPVVFQSAPFNGRWTASVFASQDPIALDSVGFDLLRNEPNVPFARTGCVDNYLHEAAQAENPPSGTKYNPSGQRVLSSLGVHEHWNNAQEKKYSRNLGSGTGIELVAIEMP